jgi:GNAT superfamily N-acetyltransferase
METIDIVEIKDPAGAGAEPAALEPFLELPARVYGGDSRLEPAPRAAVIASLARARFRGLQRLLVALEGGRAVARVVARRSPVLRDEDGRPYGLLGFFEALPRPEAARALLAEGVRSLRAAGAGPIVGPMDGDTWHRYRLNLGPWSDPPFLMEPYNPPYYPEMWEASGFEQLEGYSSLQVDDAGGLRPLLAPAIERALDAGYRFRALEAARFDEEFRVLYDLSREVFRENFLYEEISWDDFRALYEPARRLIDPELVWIAVAPGGEPAGFSFSLMDPGGAVNVKSLGVVPAHRRSGLGGALVGRTYEKVVERGLRRVNHCLMRDGNPSERLDRRLGRLLRRYALYRLKERGA